MGKATVIDFTNQKGGVTKTTSAIAFGSVLAREGYKVLIGDFDPQGNSTYSLIGEYSQRKDESGNSLPGILRAIIDDTVSLADVVQETGLENLHIAPMEKKVMGRSVQLGKILDNTDIDVIKREFANSGVLDYYDYILLDHGPKIHGFEETACLVASDYVLTPTTARALDMSGLIELIEYVKEVKKYNPNLAFLGAFFTLINKSKVNEWNKAKEYRDKYGDTFMKAFIPQESLVGLLEEGEFLIEHSKKAIRGYEDLVEESLAKIENLEKSKNRKEVVNNV
ncbi:MAG: AAA family ATPase [Oligoflexia bacterium]|nr:AAA family ATPase [Oligoflexia bacterium]